MTTTVIGQATGTIGVDGDSDWFKVQLTGGTQYVFSFGNGTALPNGQLALYDAAGNQVNTTNGPTASAGGTIVFSPAATGTYYVGASGAPGSTGGYTILESTTPADFTANTATAGTLTIGGSAHGNLTTSGQNDWFKVTLTAGQGYNFNLSGFGSGQVTVYDSNGHYLVSGNDGNTLKGDSVFFVPTVSGTYYVGASDTLAGTGAFTLSASTATYDFAGNTATSGTVAVGGTVTGAITNVGQNDWFKVTLSANKEYVFDLTGTGMIPSVSIYDAAGNLISTGYNGGANGGALVSFEPTADGTYYIGAGSLLSTTGAFSLAVSTATPDVLGTPATSGTVTVGGTVNGNITTLGQSDWYKVTLTAGSKYALTAGGGTLGGATVTLYDSTGKALTSGSGSAFFEPTATGTYYVGASGSGTGTFTVGVTSATVDFLGTTATTGVVNIGSSVNGNITHAGQNDWFKVTLTAGKEYSFAVSGALDGATVSLYDANGNLVAGGTGTGTAFTPANGGTYYVGAGSSNGSMGAFTIAAAVVTDDYANSSATTGTFSPTVSVAAALAQYSTNTLAANTQIIDSAANVQANLDALAPLVASGKLAPIQLVDSGVPTITLTPAQVISDAAVLQDIGTHYIANISGFSSTLSAFVQNQGFRYVPGTNHSGSNQAIEITSTSAGATPIALGNGFNAVIIDGDHSSSAGSASAHNYTFNVEANGTVHLLDSNTGQSQTITGASYLIFDGGAIDSTGAYQSAVFVGASINAQVTALYNAAFLRHPDLIGLEYYVSPITAGTLSLHQTAVNFLASPEFQHDYPTAAAPSDHGGANDTAFINTLYTNVLNRAAGANEVAYYDGLLASGTLDRAQILINFALSPENQQAISSFSVNTANGAYADPTNLLSATTVLNDATAGTTLNPDAIDPASVGAGVTANGITIASDGSLTLTPTAAAFTLNLTQTHNVVTVQNSGATIAAGSFDSTITLTGANNTTIGLALGGNETVNLLGGTNTTVNNFVAGSGMTLNVTNTTDPTAVQILNGSTTKIAGSSLTFGSGTSYVVNIGTVTDTSAAGIATAANKAYGAAGAAGEFVTFLAKDAAGDTLVWFWGSTTGAANGVIPASSLAAGADANGNHLVDAAELVHVANIMGVAPSSLTATDLA